jgi:hypothetical protein
LGSGSSSSDSKKKAKDGNDGKNGGGRTKSSNNRKTSNVNKTKRKGSKKTDSDHDTDDTTNDDSSEYSKHGKGQKQDGSSKGDHKKNWHKEVASSPTPSSLGCMIYSDYYHGSNLLSYQKGREILAHGNGCFMVIDQAIPHLPASLQPFDENIQLIRIIDGSRCVLGGAFDREKSRYKPQIYNGTWINALLLPSTNEIAIIHSSVRPIRRRLSPRGRRFTRFVGSATQRISIDDLDELMNAPCVQAVTENDIKEADNDEDFARQYRNCKVAVFEKRSVTINYHDYSDTGIFTCIDGRWWVVQSRPTKWSCMYMLHTTRPLPQRKIQ